MDEITTTCLSCLGGNASGATRAQFEKMCPVDWHTIIRNSGWRRVFPLLYHQLLTAHLEDVVPHGVLQRLEQAYRRTARQNREMFGELFRVLELLRSNHITVMPLKGAYLAEAVYKNIALRPMGDLDLLVRQDDIERVDKCLLEMGYAYVANKAWSARFLYHGLV